MIGNSDDETNFTHVLLINKVANFCKVFVNKSSTDTMLSKTQYI